MDIYGALSEYMITCATELPATLLDINNTVPADMIKAAKRKLQDFEPTDLFMGFHCGNTPSVCLVGGALKYQLVMHRLMEPGKELDITRGTMEGRIRPGAVTIFRLQSTAETKLRSYVAEGEVLDIDPESFGSCGTCDQCREGRTNTCCHLLFLRTPGQLSGCLVEWIIVPSQNCHPLRGGMSFEEAVLLEPLPLGGHSFQLLDRFRPERIAVLGASPIGLCVILVARAYGVPQVYAADKVEARVLAARRAGACWSGNPDREDIVAEFARREPQLLDAVFECSGDPAALDQAVDLLRPGERLMILGIPASDRVSFDIHKIRRKEISIHNVRRQRHFFDEAISLVETKKVDGRFLATHAFPLEEAAQAFELAAGYGDGVLKAVVRVSAV